MNEDQRRIQETVDANTGRIGWRCVAPSGRVFGGTVTRQGSIRRGYTGGMPAGVAFALDVQDEKRPLDQGLESDGWKIERIISSDAQKGDESFDDYLKRTGRAGGSDRMTAD